MPHEPRPDKSNNLTERSQGAYLRENEEGEKGEALY